MELIPLPDVMLALRDVLFERDGKEQAITQGWEQAIPQARQAYPLAARLEQERQNYQRRIENKIEQGVDGGNVTVTDIDGTKLSNPWRSRVAVPLFMKRQDIHNWIKGWMSKQDVHHVFAHPSIARHLEPVEGAIPRFSEVEHGNKEGWYSAHAKQLALIAARSGVPRMAANCIAEWVVANVPAAKRASEERLRGKLTKELLNEVDRIVKNEI